MIVDAYASQPHYLGHLAPIWRELPAEVRGTFYVAAAATRAAAHYGVDVKPVEVLPRDARTASWFLCAGASDLAMRQTRPAILVEHGAGQTYQDLAHPSYAGGVGRDGVGLFIVPNERVAAANAARYPTARQVIAAPWVEHLTELVDHYPRITPAKVAFTQHWNCSLLPETLPAWPHYRDAARAWAARHPHQTVLHAHPRAQVDGWYDELPHGRPIRWFDDVVRCGARVLVADNTSALWEWARIGLQVVFLNAPWYRRDVEHGLRFWSHVGVGIEVDRPEELAAAIAAASDTPQTIRQAELAADIFPVVDDSAWIAAEAILALA